jgi:hypothetical protein
MGYRPAWRAPLKASGCGVLSEAFIAKRGSLPYTAPQCTGRAKSTGERCRRVAMRHTNRCQMHGGRIAAEHGEAKRYGAKMIITRPRHRKQAIAALGAGPWPYGLPKRPDLLELGPFAKGRLFEAFANREMAPDEYRHQLRQRRRRQYS